MHIGALFRLFWRPASFGALFMISLAAMAPFVMFGGQVSAVQSAVHLGLTLPLLVGVLASSAADELLKQQGSWVLPGLRRSLAAGDVLVVLVLGGIVGAVAWRAGRAPLATAVAVLAAFWYAVGGGARLAARGPKLTGVLVLGVLVLAAAPVMYTRIVTSAMLLVTAGAAGGAVLLMRARWSRGVARKRVGSEDPERRLVSFDAIFTPAQRAGVSAPHRDGLLPTLRFWVGAARYEYAAGGRAPWYLPGMITAVITHAFQIALPVVMISVSQRGMQLGNSLLYPISRRQRATILFVCHAVDVLLLTGVFLLTFMALRAARAPVLPFVLSRPADEWPIMLAVSIALAPILQWARVRGPIPPSRIYHSMGYAFAFVIPATLLSLNVQKAVVPRTGLSGALALIAVLGIAVQLVHYVALQRLYRRTDLVASLS